MTVEQLINELKRCDPTAQVRIMSQPNWPFENRTIGIVSRTDFESPEEIDTDSKNPNDVFILQGDQICYGNEKAWNA